MTSSALRAGASWASSERHAQLAVAPHDLGQQPLLGPEVVVQQPARDAAPRARRGRTSSPRRRAGRRSSASPRRCAGPSRPRSRAAAAAAASMAPSLAGRPAEARAAPNERGRPGGALSTRRAEASRLGARGHRLGRPERATWSTCSRTPPRRRRAVSRTLLRRPSLSGERHAGADDADEQQLGEAAAALLLLGTLAQRLARVAQRLGRLLDLLVQLLVVEDLRRRLAVGQPPVGLPGVVEARPGRSRAARRPR